MVLLRGPETVLPLLAVLGALLALFNRRLALCLMLPAMALSPDISVHGVAVRIEDLMMLPLAAGWLGHICVTGTRRGTSLDRLLIAYALVAVVATAWGVSLGTVHLLTVSKYVSSPFFVLKRFEFVLLFLIVADTMETIADVRLMSVVLLASAVALSAFSAQQFLSNHAIALGPEGAPIHEPGFASMVTVALALGMMRGARGPWRFLLAACVIFGVATLPLALGRNYIVATLLILGYVGVREQRWVFLVVPLLVVLAMVVYPHGIIERILTLTHVLSTQTALGSTSTAPSSVFYRAEAPLYYATIALGHSPFLGFGMGAVPLGFIDSEYVIQLYYTGLIGLGIFLAFGAGLLRVAKAARLAVADSFDAGLAYSFQLVLAGYAIYSIFAASVSATHTGGPFFVTAALAAALHRQAVAQRARERVGAAAPPAGDAVPVVAASGLSMRQRLWLTNPLAERRQAR